MFVPKHFLLEDPARIREVLQRYDFALLITATGGVPSATHLPMLYDETRGDKGVLLGHMARANAHWKDLATLSESGGEALAVFQGPHAYISPTWYGGGKPTVPTWNYVAVHAYGTPRLIEDPIEVAALLDRLVEVQEQGQDQPWSTRGLEESFLSAMRRGVVAFEIPISRLQAKAKLSQNKEPAQIKCAADTLLSSDDPQRNGIGSWMAAALQAKGD